MTTAAKEQEIQTLRDSARGLRERAKLSTEEAKQLEALADEKEAALGSLPVKPSAKPGLPEAPASASAKG